MSRISCGHGGRFARALSLAAALSLTLSGCQTVSDWFTDEEELEIRRLNPIESQFELQENWSVDIGDGVDSYFSRLRPVYAYDMIFAADRHGTLVALNPENGDRIWEKDFAIFREEGFFSSVSRLWNSGESAKLGGISVADNKLFVGTEDGLMMALDAKTGEPLWDASVAGEILAPPAYDEGIVVINTGAGVLFGFDANTGEQLWTGETDVPPLTLRGISGPVASNGGVLTGTPTGKLQANILDSGLMAWDTPIATPSGATELERIVDIDTTPILFGGTIYAISYNGTLAAVELRSGRVIWKREYGSYRDVTMRGNQLYVVDTQSHVYALDRRNGVELWSQSGLKKRSLTSAEPIGQYLVVGDKWGFLHWINQEDGKIVARYDVGGDDEDEGIFVAPLVVNNHVIVTTRDGELVSLSGTP